MAEQYAPYDEKNPWKLDSFLNADEWKEVSRWYSHSLRQLLPDGRWYEYARCGSRDKAYQIMKALAARPGHPEYYVIVQCTLVGKDGREKAVVFSGGSEQMILREREARLGGSHAR